MGREERGREREREREEQGEGEAMERERERERGHVATVVGTPYIACQKQKCLYNSAFVTMVVCNFGINHTTKSSTAPAH